MKELKTIKCAKCAMLGEGGREGFCPWIGKTVYGPEYNGCTWGYEKGSSDKVMMDVAQWLNDTEALVNGSD